MSTTNHFIQVQNAEMVFNTRKGRFHALREIDLTVAKGEFITLIGHSGCGKSTLLNLIAGLLLPTSGVLLCDNKEINAPGPERAVVFQNHSLLPWLTCFENVYLAVERVFGASEAKAQLKLRTKAALELVGMGHALHKRPHEVSGGMKQRVGIARALAMRPKAILFDEPTSALDPEMKGEIIQVMEDFAQDHELTMVIVTHEPAFVERIATRIVKMGPHGSILSDQSRR